MGSAIAVSATAEPAAMAPAPKAFTKCSTGCAETDGSGVYDADMNCVCVEKSKIFGLVDKYYENIGTDVECYNLAELNLAPTRQLTGYFPLDTCFKSNVAYSVYSIKKVDGEERVGMTNYDDAKCIHASREQPSAMGMTLDGPYYCDLDLFPRSIETFTVELPEEGLKEGLNLSVSARKYGDCPDVLGDDWIEKVKEYSPNEAGYWAPSTNALSWIFPCGVASQHAKECSTVIGFGPSLAVYNLNNIMGASEPKCNFCYCPEP